MMMGTAISAAALPPVIFFSPRNLPENSSPGVYIGTLSVPNTWGPYTWELLDNAGDMVDLDGEDIVAGSVEANFEDTPELEITVRGTPTTGGGPSLTQTFTVVVVNEADIPVNIAPPSFTGTAQEGQTAMGNPGAWTNSPTSYSYRWYRNSGSAGAWVFTGGVNLNRIYTAADIGYRLRLGVIALNDDGYSTEVFSAQSAVVTAASVPILVNTTPPVIGGSTLRGQTLSVTTPGVWTNSPTGIDHQWRLNGVDIPGATGTDYQTTAADDGGTITVREFATNAGGTAGATSNAIGPIVSNVLTDVMPSVGPVAENSAAGVLVGTFSGAHPMATVTMFDDDGGHFVLAGSGNNEIRTGLTALNYEGAGGTTRHVTIRQALTGGSPASKDTVIDISVLNVNEAPTNITVTWRGGFSGGVVPEDTAPLTVLADLAFTDPDAGDSGAFTEVPSSDTDDKFTVTGTTLVLANALDYETDTSHPITIRFTDAGGLTYDKAVTVLVSDVSEGLPKLARHSRLVTFTDGLGALPTCKGLANYGDRGLLKTGFKVRRAIAGDQGVSGDNMDVSMSTRGNWTDVQNADLIWISMGHNPPYSLDPNGSETIPDFVTRFMTRWLQIIDDRIAANPNARIGVGTTLPAVDDTNTDAAAAIWAAQEAAINARIAAGNQRLTLKKWHVGFVPATMTFDGIHLNSKGGDHCEPFFADWINENVEDVSIDTMLDETAAITSKGLGANLHTNHNLTASGYQVAFYMGGQPTAGDALQINGVTITWGTTVAIGANAAASVGNLRTHLDSNKATYGLTTVSSAITSNTYFMINASTAITVVRTGTHPYFINGRIATGFIAACSMGGVTVTADVVSGEQIFTVTGVPTAAGTIIFEDVSNVAHAGVRFGGFIERLMGVIIDNGTDGGVPDGLLTFGAGSGGTNQGIWLNGGAVDANSPANHTATVNSMVRTFPKVLTSAALGFKTTFTMRLSTTVTNTGRTIRLKLRKPIDREVETKAYSRPVYMGDDLVEGGGNGTTVSPTPAGQPGQMGPAATPANGSSITARTGLTQGGNITYSPAWYKNVPSDLAADKLPTEHPTSPVSPFASAVSTGTLSGLVSGDKLRFYPSPTNDFLGAGTKPLKQPYIEYTVP